MLSDLISNNQTLENDPHLQPGSDLDKFINILSKSIESRTPKQISGLLEYVSLNKGLNDLAEKTSSKFMKTILMKYASAVYANGNSLITEEGDKINNIYILLYGKIAATKKQEDYDTYITIQKLGKISIEEFKQNNKLKRRRISKLLSKQFCLGTGNFPKNKIDYKQEDLHERDVAGFYDRSIGTKYLNNVISLVPSLLLEIPITDFVNCFHAFFEERIKNTYEKIQHFPCFLGMEKEKIQTFIINLSEKKQKRGTFIYKQGQPTHSLYLLSHGQIKLTKCSNLFVENPNNLYANRVSLMSDTHTNQQTRYNGKQQQMPQQTVLPYADLTQMYNYSPKKKMIQISVIQPFCIFGSEEFTEGKKRQTNAICNSLDVTYYEISIDTMKEFFGVKVMASFFKGLKIESKNKVLQRQLNYANTINLQNRANLNYFYIEGDKEISPPKKFRINKLNSKLIEENFRQREKFQSLENHSTIPKYTAFNFEKIQLLTRFQTPTKAQKNRKLQKRYSNPQSRGFNKFEDDSPQHYTMGPSKQELRIMNMTHTMRFMKDKIQSQSLKLAPKKITIDVHEPLIDNNYLRSIQKQKKRIENKIRKQKIGSLQSRVSSFTTKGLAGH